MLKNKNIISKRPSKKLDQKFLGPYLIKRKLGAVIYELDLLKGLKIYPRFYVELLELVLEGIKFAVNKELVYPELLIEEID